LRREECLLTEGSPIAETHTPRTVAHTRYAPEAVVSCWLAAQVWPGQGWRPTWTSLGLGAALRRRARSRVCSSCAAADASSEDTALCPRWRGPRGYKADPLGSLHSVLCRPRALRFCEENDGDSQRRCEPRRGRVHPAQATGWPRLPSLCHGLAPVRLRRGLGRRRVLHRPVRFTRSNPGACWGARGGRRTNAHAHSVSCPS